MLVLSRKPGEKVRVGGDITITIVAVSGNRVQIGIEAPAPVPILRGELACRQDPGQSVSPGCRVRLWMPSEGPSSYTPPPREKNAPP
jgi:carbon storage regulator